MVKHTQTIHWQQPTNCLNLFDHFVGLALNCNLSRQNSDMGISDFQISGQSFIKENCHNSITSDDIDMKLGSVTKIDKRNKSTSKIFDDDVTSENCDAIIIFSLYGQFGDIRKPDSRHRVHNTYVFINSNLLSYKN